MFQLRNLFLTKREPRPFQSEFTKDWDTLEQSPEWLFFEYGEFKKGHAAHQHLGCDVISHAYTQHKCPLWMWNDNQDAFPIAMNVQPMNQPFRKARIMGEIFKIPTNQIPHLDAYRQNGVQFLRKFVSLILPNQVQIRAQTYIGAKEYWKERLDWANSFFRGREHSSLSVIEPHNSLKHPWLGYYANYTPNDLQPTTTRCYLGLRNGIRQDPAPKQAPTPTPAVS